MIALLAFRTLADRPRRTAFLLFGFGIAVGVMIVLLSIGEAVLDQARDADLVGGGDVVLLPAGVDVEVMKVGGATGMFFAVDDARFVVRSVLSGPRWAPLLGSVPAPEWPSEPQPPPLAAACPIASGKLLYVRRAGRDAAPRRVLATGTIPSLAEAVRGPLRAPSGAPLAWTDSHADRMWLDPPADSLYDDMDRFHLPPPGLPHRDTWAEWLYFNFTDPRTDAHGYASFIAAGDIAAGKGRALPLLQIVRPGAPPERYQGDMPLARDDISLERVALRFGSGTRADFAGGAWILALDWESPAGRVRGALRVEPVRDLYVPPFAIQESERFVSGYTVPAIRATASGWIEAGGRRLELRDAPAYHDHNWGTWRDVHWDWGTASDAEHALFYGRVVHPELQAGKAGVGLFLALAQARRPGERGGLLGVFRPEAIDYDWRPAPPLPGDPERVPAGFRMRAASDAGGDSLAVRFAAGSVAATPPRAGAEPLVFLQARGAYEVRARIAGRTLAFHVPGFAETFVPPRYSTSTSRRAAEKPAASIRQR